MQSVNQRGSAPKRYQYQSVAGNPSGYSRFMDAEGNEKLLRNSRACDVMWTVLLSVIVAGVVATAVVAGLGYASSRDSKDNIVPLVDDYFMRTAGQPSGAGVGFPSFPARNNMKRSNTKKNTIDSFRSDTLSAEDLATKLDMIKAVLQRRTEKLFNATQYPCSSYRAFGERGTKQGFLPTLNASVVESLDRGLTFNVQGGFAIGKAGDDFFEHYNGFRSGFPGDVDRPLFTRDTIIKPFSDSRLIGSLATLRALEYFSGNTAGKTVQNIFSFAGGFSEFDNQRVIQVYTPEKSGKENTAVSTSAASNLVTITTSNPHGLVTGDLVALNTYNLMQSTRNPSFNDPVNEEIDGIPGSEWKRTSRILVVDPMAPTTLTFRVLNPATATASGVGGNLQVSAVGFGAAPIPEVNSGPFDFYSIEDIGATVSSTSGSNTAVISMSFAHGLATGNFVGFLAPVPAVGGIPSSDFDFLGPPGLEIVRINATSFSVDVATSATSTDTQPIPYLFVVRGTPSGRGPITTTEGSTTVKITAEIPLPFVNGQSVKISGLTGPIDGIPFSEINTDHVITVIDSMSFTFDVTTAATVGLARVGPSLVGESIITIEGSTVNVTNGLATTLGSKIVTVTTDAPHNLAGAQIAIFGLAGPIGGISQSELQKTQQVLEDAPVSIQFKYASETAATAGVSGVGDVTYWAKVDADVIQSPVTFCDPEQLYYKTVPVIREATISDLLDSSYGAPAPVSPRFCDSNGDNGLGRPNAPWYLESRIFQQHFLDKGLCFSIDGVDCEASKEGQGIVDWSREVATIPLIFQPGTSGVRGPSVSIAGALIELMDGKSEFHFDNVAKNRTLEQWVKDELTGPIGMPDTQFYIQDTDADRADKLSRIATPYLPFDSLPAIFACPFLSSTTRLEQECVNFLQGNYDSSSPRVTAFFDSGMITTPGDFHTLQTFLKDGGRLANGTQLISKHLIAWASSATNRLLNSGTQLQTRAINDPTVSLIALNALGFGARSGDDNTDISSVSTRSFLFGSSFGTFLLQDFGQDLIAYTGNQMFFSSSSDTLIALENFQRHVKCIDPGVVDYPTVQ